MNVANVARGLGRDLWYVVAWGRDEPPPLLRQVRAAATPGRVAVLVIVVVVALWVFPSPAMMTSVTGIGGWSPVYVVLSAGVLVLMAYRPLLAWRLAWLALLYELAIGPWYVGDFSLPRLLAFGLPVLVSLVVLFVVAASQTRGLVFWVWLLTVLLGMAAQLVAVGVVTAVVLAGQLTRNRSQVRRKLAVAEEHGLVLAERARIARELHDVIAHHMSMIAVRAETAPYRLRTVPLAAREEFLEISQESRTALTEMRRLLGVLRSDQPAGGDQPAPPTAPQPGLTDLADLVESARAAGATVALEMHGAMTGLPAAVDVSAYRIVQEALTNATRHAAGAPVRIMLRRTGQELSLSVRNGRGAPGEPGAAGHGVRGMRERVAALGGELHAGPTAEGGFEVSATLPLAGVTP